MTAAAELPRPKRRLARKRGGLFVTDAELVEELGVPADQAWAAIRMLDAKKKARVSPRKIRFGATDAICRLYRNGFCTPICLR